MTISFRFRDCGNLPPIGFVDTSPDANRVVGDDRREMNEHLTGLLLLVVLVSSLIAYLDYVLT